MKPIIKWLMEPVPMPRVWVWSAWFVLIVSAVRLLHWYFGVSP